LRRFASRRINATPARFYALSETHAQFKIHAIRCTLQKKVVSAALV
jgi:hypothetical protein